MLGRVEETDSATRRRDSRQPPSEGAGAWQLREAALKLRRGTSKPLERVINSLGEAGYERVAQVTTRGQFAVRGGSRDVYSWQAAAPIRAEFFDDEIESLREFDLDMQTSLRNLDEVELLLGAADDQSGKVLDYVRKEHLRVVIEDADENADVSITEGWLASTSEQHSGEQIEVGRSPAQ